MSQNSIQEPPEELRRTLPSPAQVRDCLAEEGAELPAGTALHRAAYSLTSILPESIVQPYRFGPPKALALTDGTMPFWWLYMALDPVTTIWEARFCQNDPIRPGTFFFNSSAEQNGLIATIRFPRALRLWDMNGEAASRLGIYDQLSSPDYEWCQWFGVRLHEAFLLTGEATRPDGVIYPSRRHRGNAAIILASSALETMRSQVLCEHVRFVSHPAYERLRNDSSRVPPPPATAV